MDSGSWQHFIDPELIRRVESRMLEYTRIEPPKEIRAAGDNVLCGTAQGILPVVVRGTDNVLRTVKLPIHSACAWFKKESILHFGSSSKRR